MIIQNAIFVKDVKVNAREIAVIVAVDDKGGYCKDGKIPWHYPDDMKWFRKQTKDKICVMGRTTYEDMNAMMGERGKESVLPGRKCFVVSTTLTELPNATVIKSIREAELHLDSDDMRDLFILGGYNLFVEGVSIADVVYLTLINKNYQCDKDFPVEYVTKHFTNVSSEAVETAPDLRFTVWRRNGK